MVLGNTENMVLVEAVAMVLRDTEAIVSRYRKHDASR